jgi:C1A family cysteine protease
MKNLRSALAGVLLVSSLAACGQNLPTVRQSAGPTSGPLAVFGKSGAGKRQLDYDWKRYKTVLAPKAKPRRSPRQGLLPTRVDLRQKDAPVYDQGDLGACTAFAMGKGMRENMQRRDQERVAPLSALFMYYESRKRQGTVRKDSGSTITDGMGVMKDLGVAPDDLWPYEVPKFKLKPPATAYESAKEYKIKGATQLAAVDDVRQALAQGKPVAFGFLVYKSFDDIGKDGVMPMPKEHGDKILGGHAVVAVGYDDQKRLLTVRNSWGPRWADQGYFYMPYEFANDREKSDDFWAAD